MAKITGEGLFIEALEQNPGRFLPDVTNDQLSAEVVQVDLSQPMAAIRSKLAQYPVRTRLSLTGTLVVARDIAHAKLQERIEKGEGLPQAIKDHIIYYAGPAKTPEGFASGSFGPTTAGGWVRTLCGAGVGGGLAGVGGRWGAVFLFGESQMDGVVRPGRARLFLVRHQRVWMGLLTWVAVQCWNRAGPHHLTSLPPSPPPPLPPPRPHGQLRGQLHGQRWLLRHPGQGQPLQGAGCWVGGRDGGIPMPWDYPSSAAPRMGLTQRTPASHESAEVFRPKAASVGREQTTGDVIRDFSPREEICA